MQQPNAANLQRPDGLTAREQNYIRHMGERGYRRFEALKKSERQRVWDNMRRIAGERYKLGLMPPWFQKEWLNIEEAPTNTWWRQQGLTAYKMDTTWLGDNAPSTSSGHGGGGGSGMLLLHWSSFNVQVSFEIAIVGMWCCLPMAWRRSP
eukprot:GHRR01009485.1.p1 GENE.GHRR01009485.1~~GHRR01009485.1.p1  ORF type:complete len:150 (+),score=40.45 GHRR01009485.1:281-730(+)